MKKTVYDVITERLLADLETGTAPWRKTWSGDGFNQRNAVTGYRYRGVNLWLTLCAGYSDPRWITTRQLEKVGGRVKRSEWKQYCPIVFYPRKKVFNKETGREEEKFLGVRFYQAYNLEQCELPEGWVLADLDKQINFDPIESAEGILEAYQDAPSLEHKGGQAFYRPSTDSVTMPKKETFESPQAYYATLFHELTHSTGHEKRLNREGVAERHAFGDPVYSREELIAEMGSAFLMGNAGLKFPEIEKNQASYLAGWIKAIKGNPKLLIEASSKAQKAADYILGFKQ